mgnify:CR=1 FL=1|jgi:Predicted membrane protein
MAEIPAPLANRHTAVGVVVVCLLGAASAVATFLVADAGLPLLVARQLVFAAQALVLAVAAFLVWRTLTRRSFGDAAAGLTAFAGLALLALAQLVGILSFTAWDGPVVDTIGAALTIAAAALVVLGFLRLGVAVLRQGLWHGPTRVTLLAAAVVALGAFATPLLYALWSLVLLGLAPGLTSPRPVANAGVPQGAAPA